MSKLIYRGYEITSYQDGSAGMYTAGYVVWDPDASNPIPLFACDTEERAYRFVDQRRREANKGSGA